MNVATKAEHISAMWFFRKACCLHIIMNHQRKNLIVLKCNITDRKYLQSFLQPVPTLLFNTKIKKPLARFTCYRNAVYLTYHIHVTQRCFFLNLIDLIKFQFIPTKKCFYHTSLNDKWCLISRPHYEREYCS